MKTFYSTKIVDSGLGEFFVAVKGAMIVIGTIFIQSGEISLMSVISRNLLSLNVSPESISRNQNSGFAHACS